MTDSICAILNHLGSSAAGRAIIHVVPPCDVSGPYSRDALWQLPPENQSRQQALKSGKFAAWQLGSDRSFR